MSVDLNLKDIDYNSSIKTNFKICDDNFKRLKEVSKYLREEDSRGVSKTVIEIKSNLSVNMMSNIDEYVVHRRTVDSIAILRDDFDFSTTIVQIVDSEGNVVYPAIQLKQSEILLTFSDDISRDFKIIML